MFKVFASALLERLYAQFPTVLDDFDITITDWEVLALRGVRLLILELFQFFRGKSTYTAVLFLIAHHLKVVLLYLVLLVLLNDEAEVFDLPFHRLVNRARLDNCWWLARFGRCGRILILGRLI